jgi:PAS domain S-box-containing protein
MIKENNTDKFTDLRRRAEKTLPTKSPVPDGISIEEFFRVLHELEVHQIELEMQNEELRTTQLDLETLYRQYVSLYDFAPVGYLTLSDSGLILEANLTAAVMLNVGKNDLLQQPLAHFVFRDDQDAFYHYRKQLFESHMIQVCELRWVKPDGAHFFVRLEGLIVEDSEAQVSQSRLTVSDVSARQHIEMALRAIEERHRIISELTSDLIYSEIVYPNSLVETNWLSGSVERITGYTMDEIHDLAGGWRAIVHPDELLNFKSSWLKLLANETLVIEYRIFTKDREVRWFRDYKKPVWDESAGRVTLIWGAVQDITERKRAEEALHQYTIELEARNEELDAFAYTVAHDLKNPLGLILGYSQLLADDDNPLPPEKTQFSIASIKQAVDKMDHIMNDLLLLASVSRGEVAIKPLDMASIMSGVWYVLGQMIEEYQAIIVVPDTWPVAQGYGPWVEAVWTNYLSNALKYGGKPPRIELGATVQSEGMVHFWVRDNGPGLTPDDQSHLFVPFSRLAPNLAEGNGLGLSIVRRIIERLDGQISIKSEVGQGSVFGFSLPSGMD